MKQYKLSNHDIIPLIPDIGTGFATDSILVDGKPVDFMSHEADEKGRSHWVFYGGDETQAYLDDTNNTRMLALNTIANYAPDIIPFLSYPVGAQFKRNEHGVLKLITTDVAPPEMTFLFPFQVGKNAITEDWSIEISEMLYRRIDNDSLVVWKQGFSIWVSVFDTQNQSTSDVVAWVKQTTSEKATDIQETTDNGITKIRYHLLEDGQPACYMHAISTNSNLLLSIYYDGTAHQSEIEKIWQSIVNTHIAS